MQTISPAATLKLPPCGRPSFSSSLRFASQDPTSETDLATLILNALNVPGIRSNEKLRGSAFSNPPQFQRRPHSHRAASRGAALGIRLGRRFVRYPSTVVNGRGAGAEQSQRKDESESGNTFGTAHVHVLRPYEPVACRMPSPLHERAL